MFILGAISSCMARKEYERPKNVVDEKLFRTDMLPSDSASIADISWKEIFTDPILQGHISKALENNLDIRIALESINSAEAYLKQSKSGLSADPFCRTQLYVSDPVYQYAVWADYRIKKVCEPV